MHQQASESPLGKGKRNWPRENEAGNPEFGPYLPYWSCLLHITSNIAHTSTFSCIELLAIVRTNHGDTFDRLHRPWYLWPPRKFLDVFQDPAQLCPQARSLLHFSQTKLSSGSMVAHIWTRFSHNTIASCRVVVLTEKRLEPFIFRWLVACPRNKPSPKSVYLGLNPSSTVW